MSLRGSMFDNIIEWYLGRAGDRRQYQRRSGAFQVWCQVDPMDATNLKQGVGLEISPNGLMFLLDEPIGVPEYDIVIRLREQTIPVRVKGLRSDQVQHQGRLWNCFKCEFMGIAADHWDMIVRYINDEPEPQRRRMQNQEPSGKVDDAYRLLPAALQQKIIEMLVAQHKLEAPKPGETPLLKLFYGGLVKRPGQKPAHRFNVHSRVKNNDKLIAYDTRLLIGEEGEIIQVS